MGADHCFLCLGFYFRHLHYFFYSLAIVAVIAIVIVWMLSVVLVPTLAVLLHGRDWHLFLEQTCIFIFALFQLQLANDCFLCLPIEEKRVSGSVCVRIFFLELLQY